MSNIFQIILSDETTHSLTLSNVITSTPAEISDLSDMPIDTGWTVSNVTSTKTLNASATSLSELADVVGTLVQKLIDAGVLND